MYEFRFIKFSTFMKLKMMYKFMALLALLGSLFTLLSYSRGINQIISITKTLPEI